MKNRELFEPREYDAEDTEVLSVGLKRKSRSAGNKRVKSAKAETIETGSFFDGESEDLIDLPTYRRLKLKEYEGKISKEEFEDVLVFDTKEAFDGIEPIEKDLDPESEVGKILKLPTSERKQALADFKDKYARQREALAKCRVFIERFILVNPDIEKDKLMRIVRKFGRRYGFTKKQEDSASWILDSFYEHRGNALKVRDKYPRNADLVNALTGLNFKDDSVFKISIEPLSLEIETDGVNANRVHAGSQIKRKKFPSGGFADQIGNPPERVFFYRYQFRSG